MRGYKYLVLGSGRQGVAAAYDLSRFGNAERVILADHDLDRALASAERINRLLKAELVEPQSLDVEDEIVLGSVLSGIDGFVSAVPYKYNLNLTGLAIKTRTSMVDMGGHTDIVRRQLELSPGAKAAGTTIVPDCGMGPGMNITMALFAMSLLDRARTVRIYDGGLPQDPRPPYNYNLFFNINGLINEYDGYAYFLRGGKVVKVETLTELEEIEIPGVGRLEAFVTSGGLSTMPFTYEGRLETLENKTIRYPGHSQIFKAYKDLGLFQEEPIEIDGVEISPRKVISHLLEPILNDPEAKDIGIIHVVAEGEKGGKMARATVSLIDYYDPQTGFRAMERLTGFHTAIVLALAVRGEIEKGVIPIERVFPGEEIIKLLEQRGWEINWKISSDN